MASTPSCIAVWPKDTRILSLQTAVFIMRQLFQFGLKELQIDNNKIMIYLTYTPKESTLVKKIGLLPVGYERVNVKNAQEYKMLSELQKKYKFNLSDAEAMSCGLLAPQPSTSAAMPQTQHLTALTEASVWDSAWDPEVFLEEGQKEASMGPESQKRLPLLDEEAPSKRFNFKK